MTCPHCDAGNVPFNDMSANIRQARIRSGGWWHDVTPADQPTVGVPRHYVRCTTPPKEPTYYGD